MRIAPVFHVTRDGEQLHRRHDVRRRVNDDLVGSFERDGIALAQVERIQRAIGWILKTKNNPLHYNA